MSAPGDSWTILDRPKVDFGPSRARFWVLRGDFGFSERVFCVLTKLNFGSYEHHRISNDLLPFFA